MTAALESDFTLKDGAVVHIRPIRPEDDHALVGIFNQLSPQTVYQRFFQALPELSPGMARYLANVNQTNRMALSAQMTRKWLSWDWWCSINGRIAASAGCCFGKFLE
jgi:hypothetical protein